MCTTTGRVFIGMTRVFFSRGILIHDCAVRRLTSVRCIGLSSRLTASTKKPIDDIENNEPIKFSTSKASHRTWKVHRPLGNEEARPWWKVLPISLIATGILLWCALRKQTDFDTQLEQQLNEQLPNSLSEQAQINKKS